MRVTGAARCVDGWMPRRALSASRDGMGYIVVRPATVEMLDA